MVDDNVETGGDFLVGVGDKLYEISDDYQVGQYINNYMCVGCGADHAMGALHAVEKLSPSITRQALTPTPEDKVTMALEAASAFSGWVCEPYHIIST